MSLCLCFKNDFFIHLHKAILEIIHHCDICPIILAFNHITRNSSKFWKKCFVKMFCGRWAAAGREMWKCGTQELPRSLWWVSHHRQKENQDSDVSSRKSRYHQDNKQLQVNMEPESSKRECWAVSAGNSYEQEERMVFSIIIAVTIKVLAIIITNIIVIALRELHSYTL